MAFRAVLDEQPNEAPSLFLKALTFMDSAVPQLGGGRENLTELLGLSRVHLSQPPQALWACRQR